MLKDYLMYLFSRKKLVYKFLGENPGDFRQIPLLLFWNVPLLEDLFYSLVIWILAMGIFREQILIILFSLLSFVIGSFVFYLLFRKQAKKEYWRKTIIISGHEPGLPDKKQLLKFRFLDVKYLVLPDKSGEGYAVAAYRSGERAICFIFGFLFFASGLIGKHASLQELLSMLIGVMIISVLARCAVFLLPRKWRTVAIQSGNTAGWQTGNTVCK